LNADSGSDTFNVGSVAPLPGGTLGGIAAPLVVNGAGGRDVMNVDDSGDSSDQYGRLTPTALTGLDLPSSINYSGLASVKITLGSGNNSFTIDGTHGGSTLVAGGSGNNTFAVQAIDGNTLVEGGTADDRFIVGGSDASAARTAHAIRGPLMLDGGGGTNTLVV